MAASASRCISQTTARDRWFDRTWGRWVLLVVYLVTRSAASATPAASPGPQAWARAPGLLDR